MQKLIDLTGQKIGRLTVISRTENNRRGFVYWNCLCECGNSRIIRGDHLKNKTTKSCGCLLKELKTTHGMSKTPEYYIWAAMIQRCNNPNDKAYKNYGSRGIIICVEWLNSFETFYANMGKRPKGLTLERIDNNGNYEPSNCAWRPRTENNRNQRIQKNNKTGIRDVRWSKRLQKYRVGITVNRKRIHIGLFDTLQQAKISREQGEMKYWGKQCK